MNRAPPLLWPLLVGALSLGATAWLWQHERETQQRTLRSNFEFGLRQTATRIEQRMASYEQMLRGLRGLFEVAAPVSRERFSTYVDMVLTGADSAGLRSMTYAPLLRRGDVEAHIAAQRASGFPDYAIVPAPGDRDELAPITYLAPTRGTSTRVLGYDPLTEATRREALLLARDSGGLSITHAIRSGPTMPSADDPAFLMFMPLYARGADLNSVAARRAAMLGWVSITFRIGDLMASLYGEGAPGLDVVVHDGAGSNQESRIYPMEPASQPAPGASIARAAAPRFEAQEYLAVAGHTWTLAVRSTPAFEQHFSNDSTRIIAIAGGGLSLVLALLTWLLVTARDRAHAAARMMTGELRDSTERYRRIVETASEGIWTVDADGRTSFVNPKMQQMLGYDAQELRGRRWFDFMDDTGRAALARAQVTGHEGAVTPAPHGEAEPLAIRFRRRDGSELWASLSTSRIVDESGAHAGTLAMVTDVTERQLAEANRLQLEAQLRQSQKMEAIGTLAGGIAHDFNNILAAILGNVGLAQQELPPGHPTQSRMAQIARAGSRARSLVQQIVAFSRQQPQQRVNQPLRPLLEETFRLLRSTLPALVDIELRLCDEPLRVDADATQLQQVVMNLCTNAWHALQGSTGRIVIGLGQRTLSAEAARRLGVVLPGGYAHLWVSDNGSGMDEATRLRAFEPFYTTKPVGQGTGLGLSVVHGIVTAHGGAITVESSPGHGSRFDMVFPLVEAPAVPDVVVAAEPPAPRGEGQHVLYVDDDPVMLLMVEGLLRNLGYRVTCIEDPKLALAGMLARDNDPDAPDAVDVVVTDFNMPELSGLELVEALARARPGLPMVITSGYVSDRMRADALRAGVSHVLQKEYTLERLGWMIHLALADAAGRPPEPPPPTVS